MALPYTFTNGTVADADQVQEQFQYLEDKTAQADYYAYDATNSSGLTFAYKAGKVRNVNAISTTAAGTVTLTPSVTNYIELDPTDGTVSVNTTDFTSGQIPLFSVAAGLTAFGAGDVSDVRTPFLTGTGGATYEADESSLTKSGTTFSVKDGGITDAKIGNRTADPSLATPASTGTLTQLLSWITGRIKAITGKTNWYDAPDTTLAAAATHIAAAAPHSGHLKTDGSTPLTGDWDTGGFQLKNLADPTDAQDGVTKAYADALASALPPKAAVLVATTGNVGSLNGLLTVDGVTLADGDRVLVWQQTTPSENGIYVASSGSWSRASDADSGSELDAGANVFVRAGTSYGRFKFTQIASVSTIGTDPQTWTESESGGGGGESNTGANLGAGDAEYFKAKSGVTLQFRTPVSDNAALVIATDGDNVRYTVDPAGIDPADLGGTLPATKGGTGLTAAALGDMLYASAANVWSRLTGNTTATRKFLTSVGNGTDAAAPSYTTLVGGDLPLATQSTRGAVPPGNNLGPNYYYNAAGGLSVPAADTRLTATSTGSSNTVGLGNKTFNNLPTGMSWTGGMWLIATSSSNLDAWMIGQVFGTYNPATNSMTLDVQYVGPDADTTSTWRIGPATPPTANGGGSSGHAFRAILAAIEAETKLGLRKVGGDEVTDIADIGDGDEWSLAIEANSELSVTSAVAVANVTGTETKTGLIEIGTIQTCPDLELVQGEVRTITGDETVTYNGVDIEPGDSIEDIEAAIQASGSPGDDVVEVTGSSSGGGSATIISANGLGGPATNPELAFDGNLGTAAGDIRFASGYIGALFPSPQTVSLGRIHADVDTAITWDFESSEDTTNGADGTWTNHGNSGTGSGWREVDPGSPVSGIGFRWVRVDGGGFNAAPEEVEFVGANTDLPAELDLILYYPASAGDIADPTTSGGTVTTVVEGGTAPDNAVVANL